MSICDWCKRPIVVGEECRVGWRKAGPALWWHLECAEQAIKSYGPSSEVTHNPNPTLNAPRVQE
jgi:RNase P subunit RPR2